MCKYFCKINKYLIMIGRKTNGKESFTNTMMFGRMLSMLSKRIEVTNES